MQFRLNQNTRLEKEFGASVVNQRKQIADAHKLNNKNGVANEQIVVGEIANQRDEKYVHYESLGGNLTSKQGLFENIGVDEKKVKQDTNACDDYDIAFANEMGSSDIVQVFASQEDTNVTCNKENIRIHISQNATRCYDYDCYGYNKKDHCKNRNKKDVDMSLKVQQSSKQQHAIVGNAIVDTNHNCY